MHSVPDHQCRRCGTLHEETLQSVDPDCRWAVVTVACGCGHTWSIIHAAPANLPALRAWVARGCPPESGPPIPAKPGAWRSHRLEGVAMRGQAVS